MMEDKSGGAQSVGGNKNVLHPESIKIEEGSWWQRRSKLERKLVVFGVFFFLVAVALAIVLIVQHVQRSEKPEEELQKTTPSPPVQQSYCETRRCLLTSLRISRYANFSVDPCEDFYEYACGSWMVQNQLPPGLTENNILILLNTLLVTNVRKLLETPVKPGDAAAMFQAKLLYVSCLNQVQINTRGDTPLRNTLSEIGGWPILNPAWDGSSYEAHVLLSTLASYAQIPLIKTGLEINPYNTSEYKISMDQPDFGMGSRDYYLLPRNDSRLMAYQTFITNVAIALGADSTRAGIEAKEIVDFEIQLANVTVPATERTNLTKLYTLNTVEEMIQKYPGFKWLDYLQAIMSADGIGINVGVDEVILNKSPSYFGNLSTLLTTTPARTQVNYLVWMFTKSRLKLLGSNFAKFVEEYETVVLGGSSQAERPLHCAIEVNTAMPLAVGRLYADAHFDEATKSAVLELISYLTDALNDMIDEADWMDDETRALAREKAALMDEKIGYPDAIKNNSYLDDYYKTRNFNVTLYFENDNQASREGWKETMRQYREVVDRDVWPVKSAEVGAYHHYNLNEIIFPSGILQPPFYDGTQPWSINFGGMGSFIGHEITHGYDTLGKQFDKYGILREWWTDEVSKRFNERAKCFVNQTSGFIMPEANMPVNGLLTLGEDVADNGGVKQSFRAYRKWVAKQGKEEPLLPGVSLNHNQLFFLAWTQTWCTSISPGTAIFKILTDNHSPNRIRAFSPFRNFPEFAKAYNCPKGSFMNPTEQCTVW